MICPNCNQPKEKEDFYWHKILPGNTPQKRYKECKTCVLAKRKKELEEKNAYNKQFFI